MATTKKFVSLDKLRLYDEKIKKVIGDGDTAALNTAKAYADSLAVNYDIAGAAATAEANAKAYADKKDTAIQAAQTAADNAAAAAAVADGKAVAAQGEVDALETYVGTIPEGATATNVVAYVQEKTSGIATSENLRELTERVAQAEKDIDNVEKDYLKAADKTELEGKITTAQNTADGAATAAANAQTHSEGVAADLVTEAETARAAEKANADAIKAISDDYLKASDKTELEGKINTEKERAEGVENGLKGRIETMEAFWTAAQADGTDSNVIDTLKEIQEYIASDETGASDMLASIQQNATDIEAVKGRMQTAETKLATIDEDADVNVIEVVKVNGTALTVSDKAVDVIVPTGALASKDKVAEGDLESALATKINGKADQTAVDQSVGALEDADEAQVERIAALEAKFGGADGSVEDMIEDAKQAAITAAASDAAAKDTALETALKQYADAEDAKIESRVDALETASATHALNSDLTALAGRVTTAEGEIDTLQSEMDAVEELAAANKTAHEANAAAIALKASQADLEALTTRVANNEAAIAAFVEVSEEEINALFA